MKVGFPNWANSAYTEQREALRQAEIALKEQVEQVAALRRTLPASGSLPQNYTFQAVTEDNGDTKTVALSDLFTDGHDHLIIMHFMYTDADTAPCPMCAMWADGYNAVQDHIKRRANFAVVVKAGIAKFSDLAKSRHWDNLTLLSSAGTSFNSDFSVETPDGHQLPAVSVFRKTDGQVEHIYTASALMGDDHYRGLDLLSPVWNFFDLLPTGRGDFMPSNL